MARQGYHSTNSSNSLKHLRSGSPYYRPPSLGGQPRTSSRASSLPCPTALSLCLVMCICTWWAISWLNHEQSDLAMLRGMKPHLRLQQEHDGRGSRQGQQQASFHSESAAAHHDVASMSVPAPNVSNQGEASTQQSSCQRLGTSELPQCIKVSVRAWQTLQASHHFRQHEGHQTINKHASESGKRLVCHAFTTAT